MRPEMGIFAIRSTSPPFCYLETTQDLKSAMNRAVFQLRFGSHPHQELQRTWKALGEDRLSLEILEVLPYSKDDAKTDYSEELQILKQLWEEKLSEAKSGQA